MVLILAHDGDLCARLTYDRLRAEGADTVFVPASRLHTDLGVSWELPRGESKSFLVFEGRKIPFDSISGVLMRIRAAGTRSRLFNGDAEYISNEWSALLRGLLNLLPCRVVNRPLMAGAESPIAGSRDAIRHAVRCGFQLPATLNTSSADDAIRFYEQHGGRVVVRTLSGRSSRQLTADEKGVGRLRMLVARSPVRLQEAPAGERLRVYTVARRAFGASIPEGHTPARRAELLPPIERQCALLARALHLDFAQIELVKGGDGRLHCLDVIRVPSIVKCEERLKERITSALAELLTSQAVRRSPNDSAGRPIVRSGRRGSLHAAVGQRR